MNRCGSNGSMDITLFLLILFGSVFALYIGVVAFGSFSHSVVPEDVYGNGTVYIGGIGSSNEINSSLVQVDNIAASGFSLLGYIPLVIVAIMFLVILGFKLKG